MSGVTIDFPLILVILVGGSGLIWLLDALFLAPGRKKVIAELQEQYPNWDQEDNPQHKQFSARVQDSAAEPVLVEYARSFFPVLFVVFVLRSFIVEPFQIPSSSMVPTLQVGDYILVNKYTYGIRLPVTRTKVMALNEPQRGDVMVFFPPHMNDTYYIKRVIGLPGDKVTYRDKRVYVNGELVDRDEVAVAPGPDASYRLGLEALGEARFMMQVNDARRPINFSVVVKPGHYFMMGDNRDNSSDSRIWGQVPEKDIVGKAFAIWMHWDSFLSFPSFARVGYIE
ncbi:signal peptidase I [Pseudohalioglobus lutimaris]|uniref:Signal peptidase I n=1 Tax=Pseudohalioglobus lutimaris TaxID=1737061 RepID=A0A2N5X0I6_9GAMM|nr:signal peptidase I [Pseudohalioglobus lutimaris]PLW68013.1 signal peptidase I [Pseudohalioglobus lutimaris]